jgi:hypothetical protein
MKPNTTKAIPLDELEERARRMTLAALESYVIPDEIRPTLTLGIHFEGDTRVFELYVPGEKPSDARIISRLRLNIYSGEGDVEVIGLNRK